MNSDIVACLITNERVHKSTHCPGQICGKCDYSPRPAADRKTARKKEARTKAVEPPKMSEADRLQATLRCPEFIEDQKRLSELILLCRGRQWPDVMKPRAFVETLRQKWDIEGKYQFPSDRVKGTGAKDIGAAGF